MGHIKPPYINNKGLQIGAADRVKSGMIVSVKIHLIDMAGLWSLVFTQQAACNWSLFILRV